MLSEKLRADDPELNVLSIKNANFIVQDDLKNRPYS